MAEQEVVKHTKNVIELFRHREHGWGHKLREMALEIAIIVFAVSLSIWLHGLVEHRHEQAQVKTFLLGLRNDIRSDLEDLRGIEKAYRGFDANFAYLSQLEAGAKPDAARFDAAYVLANANIFLRPQMSRYQGYKSAGKLTNIEDEALLGKILTLYESAYREVASSEGGWSLEQEKFRAYREDSLPGEDGLAERYRLIVAPKGKRLLRQMVAQPQLYERYARYAALGGAIIKQIDASYPAH